MKPKTLTVAWILTVTAAVLSCPVYHMPWNTGLRGEGECCSSSNLGAPCPTCCRLPYVCESYGSMCDFSEWDGTCRRPCDNDDDCPDGCHCWEGEYNNRPGDTYPKTCRGGWNCGGVVEECELGGPECDQSHRPQTCTNLGYCLPPGPQQEGEECERVDSCGMRLTCQGEGICRRTCGPTRPCHDGETCFRAMCYRTCRHWLDECQPMGGTSASCRPLPDGGWVCSRDGVYRKVEGSSCLDSLSCPLGHGCSADRYCRRLCDANHNPCEGNVCVMNDAGFGLCECQVLDGGRRLSEPCPYSDQ
jgi:hypothetical protein